MKSEKEMLRFVLNNINNYIIPSYTTEQILSNAVTRCRAHLLNEPTIRSNLKLFVVQGGTTVIENIFMYIRTSVNPKFMSLPMSIAIYIVLTIDYNIELTDTLEEHVRRYYYNLLLEIGGLSGYVCDMLRQIDNI